MAWLELTVHRGGNQHSILVNTDHIIRFEPMPKPDIGTLVVWPDDDEEQVVETVEMIRDQLVAAMKISAPP
jgi:hypothetical protein